MTWSYQPHGRWTSAHQMTLNGKRTDFTLNDFEACARVVSMKRCLAKTIIRELPGMVHTGMTELEAAAPPIFNAGICNPLSLSRISMTCRMANEAPSRVDRKKSFRL